MEVFLYSIPSCTSHLFHSRKYRRLILYSFIMLVLSRSSRFRKAIVAADGPVLAQWRAPVMRSNVALLLPGDHGATFFHMMNLEYPDNSGLWPTLTLYFVLLTSRCVYLYPTLCCSSPAGDSITVSQITIFSLFRYMFLWRDVWLTFHSHTPLL